MKKNSSSNSNHQMPFYLRGGTLTLISSVLCILLGLLIGFIVLLCINPVGAWDAIMEVIKNFMHYSKQNLRLKNFGNTLVKTAPLLMCSLSVLFAYKVGLFNIGAPVILAIFPFPCRNIVCSEACHSERQRDQAS